jgi:outer membrane lipoprotein-sorting protein
MQRPGPRWLVVLVAVAVVTVAGVAAAGGSDTPSGEDVLDDTLTAYANAESVVGTADVTVSNDSTTATATVEFAVAGNKSRAVVDTDDGTYRAGSNGTVAWYAGPNRTIVQEYETLRQMPEQHDASVPTDRLNQTAANASVDLLREESEDGTSAYVLEVTHPNQSSDSRVTLWVAQDDRRLLRFEATDGANRTVVDYRETQFNASVHDSTFDPPADRTVTTTVERYDTFDSAQANTSFDLPEFDATFREAAVVERTGGSATLQRYVAGTDNVTVVSTTLDREFGGRNATDVTVNGHSANVTTVRGAAVVSWHHDGVTTALTVEASEDRAVELARRLSE